MTLQVVRFNHDGPKFRCRLCGHLYHEDERRAFERHVQQCGDSHEHVIHEMSPRRRELPFMGSGDDVELKDWIKANQAAILRGSKRM